MRTNLLAAALVGLLTACSSGGSLPNRVLAGNGGFSAKTSSESLVQSDEPSQSILTAKVGRGTGRVIVAPTAKNDGTFSAEIAINVHDAPPNTTFFVQRAPDRTPDGVCEGTYIKNIGVTLTTDSSGSGATHFFFERGAPFVSALQFDVVFQVYTADLSTILQSECMTVTVK